MNRWAIVSRYKGIKTGVAFFRGDLINNHYHWTLIKIFPYNGSCSKLIDEVAEFMKRHNNEVEFMNADTFQHIRLYN